MRDFSGDHRWLSINTATLRRQWPLDRIIGECAARGIGAISPWRDQVAAIGLQHTARLLRDNGLVLSGYCRGGFFTAGPGALDDNRRALDEAKTLAAPCLVLVVGGLHEGSKDIESARAAVQDGIATLLEHARDIGMPLAIEPLHPMLAADRSCINTLEQALDVCDALDPVAGGALGVVVDVYHVWWDPKLQAQIERAGAQRLLAFHVCDWLLDTRDLLNDRGMMGDGVIDIPRIRRWVEAAGYAGFSEVEIFSARDWWRRDGGEVLDTCIQRHRQCV